MYRPWAWPLIGLVIVLSLRPSDLRAGDPATVPLMPLYRTADAARSRIYIQARGADEVDAVAVREKLISAGAEGVNLFASSMIIACEAPETMDIRALIGDTRFTVVDESMVENLSAGVWGAEDLRFVKGCYDRLAEPPPPGAPMPGSDGFEDVLRLVAPETIEESKARARLSAVSGAVAERNIQQNSEFLVGRILVQLVFPESEGAGEDWTERMIADATSGAYAAALDFQGKFGHAPIHFTFKAERGVPTTFEPIATTMPEHELWIRQAMVHLGIPEDASTALMVHEYNNRGRNYYKTDWVFTAFIANSANDDDHRFADQYYTAYAFLGGPYLVIPHPAGENPYGIDPWLVFSTIFQHEMSHVFWALDEYPGPLNASVCSSRTGYLSYYNLNKVEEFEPGVYQGCPGHQPQLCIMWRAKEDHGRPVCVHTQGQLGVVDYTGNGIPDVFEAAPRVEFLNAQAETVSTPSLTVRANVYSEAVPNANPFQNPADRVSYAPVLMDANVSIDGAGSMYIAPIDGKWDEAQEELSIALSGIPVGLSRVGVVARNAFGKASAPVYKSIYFVGIRFALYGANPENDGTRNQIRVSWNTVGETFGATFDLHRIESSTGAPDTTCLAVNVQPKLSPDGVFRHFEVADASVTAGRTYRYFVKGCFDIEHGGQVKHYEVTSGTFEGQSMFAIPAGRLASHASPNPFRDKTLISVRIPESAAPSTAGGSPVADASQFALTPVSIAVFDVTGRLVKRVYDGENFAGVRTFEWDGTNEDKSRVPSGVYFVKTVAGSGIDVKKVVVVR